MLMCAAGDRCHVENGDKPIQDLEEQYDRYGIYAGKWHEPCWDSFGYKDFTFDASYAGESLEED